MSDFFHPIMVDRRPQHVGEVNCASCKHLGDFDDEGRRGFCMLFRRMRSTWHPVVCSRFVQIARERRIKTAWKGVVYG